MPHIRNFASRDSKTEFFSNNFLSDKESAEFDHPIAFTHCPPPQPAVRRIWDCPCKARQGARQITMKVVVSALLGSSGFWGREPFLSYVRGEIVITCSAGPIVGQ